MDQPSGVDSREGTGLWLFKIVAGLFIIFLLGLHFIINHLVAPEGLLTWADVVRYYQNPLIPMVEGLFLIMVVSHSLIGTRSIILDLNPSKQLLKFLDILFGLVGVTAVVYGIWLLNIIASFGRKPLP